MLLLLYLISLFLDNFLELTVIANAFKGIKIAVGLLILDAGLSMVKKMPKKTLPRAIMLCALVATAVISVCSLRISSIALMAAAALVSLSIFLGKGGARK